MVYAEVQLSGSLDFRLAIAVTYAGYSQAGNYSTYQIGVALLNSANNPTWSGSTQYWSANIGGYQFGGSFKMDFRGGVTGIQLLSTYVSHYHDANGYGADPWYSVASVDTDHTSVGDGSVGVYFSGVPRIPKPPPAPTIAGYGFDQVTANTARFRFSSTGDNGAPVTQWEFELATNPQFTNATKYGSSGTSQLTGLIPGTTYYARARGMNAAGWGAWSATASMTTLSAVKRSDAGAFEDADVFISKGGAWVPAQSMMSKGQAWVPTG